MKPLFKNAGLIGLGLIGGSLARAMKQNGIAENIIGYTKSPESSSKALELGIINGVAESIGELVQNSDIIIISTPLSSYDEIAREIGLSVKSGCIITDVGSLKLPFIEIFSRHISAENLPFLVPAHPIAGTEKTGVESGFADLFVGKKTILTPTAQTSKEALDKVSKLWQSCGSSVQIIDAAEHDKIYAEVSHLPQFLAYCYAELLRRENVDLAALKEDADFWKFTRICASHPTIWVDIFLMNKNNLLAALENFIKTLQHVGCSSMPSLISSALIKCSPHAAEFSGSGFKDFTCYKGDAQAGSLSGFVSIIEEVKSALARSSMGNKAELLEFLHSGLSYYTDSRL